MRTHWRKNLDRPFLAGVGLAFLMFIVWQFVNHYFLMEYLMAKLDMSMLYYYYVSLLVEILLASIIAYFASRAIAAKSQEIEELSRQKDSLTDALVHDLRQPLTAVIGGLSTIALDPGLPVTTRELVAIANLGAGELLGMVNDLLDITRLEAGKPLFQPQPVDVADSVRRGVGSVAELARERDQKLLPRHPPRPRAGDGRCGSPASGRHEPGRQRHQVHARWRRNRNQRWRGGECCRRTCLRYRARDRTRASASHL